MRPRELRNRVEEAIQYTLDTLTPVELEPPDWTQLDDDTPFELSYDPGQRPRNEIAVYTQEDLRALLVAYAGIRSGGYVNPADFYTFSAIERHNMEHDYENQQRGGTSAFGLRIERSGVEISGDKLSVIQARDFFTPRQLTTTKLGYAAVIASPLDISPGDIHILTKQMGYTGSDDVKQRLQERSA